MSASPSVTLVAMRQLTRFLRKQRISWCSMALAASTAFCLFLFASDFQMVEITGGSSVALHRARRSQDSALEEGCRLARMRYSGRPNWLRHQRVGLRYNERITSLKDFEPKQRPIQQFTVNDDYKLIQCRVPKVDTKQWNKIFGILTHRTPNISIDDLLTPPFKSLDQLYKFSKADLISRLSSYTTMMFVRHPIERLMSGYLDKFRKSSWGTIPSAPFPRYNIELMQRYVGRNTTSVEDFIPFRTFSRWLVDQRLPPGFLQRGQDDEHWLPMVQLCFPCVVNYTFIGRFETHVEDATLILNAIGVGSWLKYPPHPSKTLQFTEQLFSQLSDALVEAIIQRYFLDFVTFDYDPGEHFGFNRTLQRFARDTLVRLKRKLV